VERVADLAEPIKPRLRGWLHAGMVPAALIAGVVLICLARTPQAVLACAVYSVTAWLLFATSAIYHRGTWGPLGEALLRRLDHANVFLIIAGTCTPLAVLLLPPDQRSVLLWIVWTGALAGIAFRVLWVRAPRWLYTPCYLALGWAPVSYLPDFLQATRRSIDWQHKTTTNLARQYGVIVVEHLNIPRHDQSPRAQARPRQRRRLPA
jgi:hemolysin III